MYENGFPIMFKVVLVSIVIVSTLSQGNALEPENDYHKVYARDAQPYGNLVYDKSLPFVPRYRYPVRRYYGKRNGMFYGNKYNPTMYDEESSEEWSPFMDAYSGDMGLSKRPFRLPA